MKPGSCMAAESIAHRDGSASVRLAAIPAMPAARPDSELLQRFRDGEAQAFADLLYQYQSTIYGYLCRCGLGGAIRDDLFQEIFLKVSRSASTFSPERPFKPWLFAIAVNTVRSYYRKRQIVAAELSESEHASAQPSGEALVAARETAEWLEAAIASLPLAQREVVILVCAEQLPQAEVAEMLGFPLSTVKTHLRRARLTLARRLTARNARTAREAAHDAPRKSPDEASREASKEA